MSGLAIASLSLSHFRSHKAARLEFDGRPVAIVGPNGAGKTNILEAVSLLSPGRGLRRAAAEELARRPEGLGWRVHAEIEGLLAPHRVETGAEQGETRWLRIDDKTSPQIGLARITRVLWLVPAMDRLWIEAAEGRRRFLDRMTLSFVPDHAEAVLTYEKAMRDRNKLLKDGVSDARWYDALEGAMAEASALIMNNRSSAVERLMSAQTKAQSGFPHATLCLVGPEGDAELPADQLALAWAEGRRRDMAAGRTLLGPHRADLRATYVAKGIAADQCSTGEQKALLISLILSNARALRDDLGRAPVLLMDEVAAHLDEARRAALYDEICGLGAQALMTGTEASLFEALGTRAQVLHVTDDGTGSRVA